MTERRNEYRDRSTGQYSYFGNFDRMCTCGHTLGVHIAGGFECGTIPGSGAEGCTCERFRPIRKRHNNGEAASK